MDFGALPPEINSAMMYAGPGAGSMLAAAAAFEGLAADLSGLASSYQSVISGLVGGPWLGASSVSMAAAAAMYASWMGAFAVQAQEAAGQVAAGVAAYEQAFAMTVPPPVIAENRLELAVLVATNILGQNTPAIAANQTLYAEMWAQDAAAMFGYAAEAAAASQLTPFATPPQVSNPGGLAGQAGAAAGAQANVAGVVSNLIEGLRELPQAIGLPELFPSSLTMLDFGTQLEGPITAVSTIEQTGISTLGTLAQMAGSAGAAAPAAADAAAADAGAALASTAPAAGAIASPGMASLSGVTASVGGASSIGGLSTPPSWSAPSTPGASPLLGTRSFAAPQVSGAPEAGMAGAPGMGAVPGGSGSRMGSNPRYGVRLTVMGRHPAAG
jgi:PPE-repeat protein